MNRPINKDIDAYRQDVWKGLSARELGYASAALIAGAVLILILYFKCGIPINVAAMIAIPVIIGTGFNGFYSKNNMTAVEIIKKAAKIRFGKPLVYRSCSQREYQTLLLTEKTKKKKGAGHGKKAERMQKTDR